MKRRSAQKLCAPAGTSGKRGAPALRPVAAECTTVSANASAVDAKGCLWLTNRVTRMLVMPAVLAQGGLIAK